MKLKYLLASMAVLSTLSGCFGGDSDEPVADQTKIPTSAWASPTAYTAFVATVADSNEDRDLLEMDATTTAPASETELPITVL